MEPQSPGAHPDQLPPHMDPPKPPSPPPTIDVPAQVTPLDPVPVRPVPQDEPRAGGGPPVHPLAALLLLFVDNLWNLADWTVIDWIVSIPLSFVMVFVPALFIQKSLMKDRWFRAFGFAAVLGVVAAVPTSLTGNPVGLALLAWTGISKLIGKSPGK
jgi:hypothetical protein